LQETIVKRDQVVLNPDDLPGSWYNIIADLPGDFPKPKDSEEGPSKMEFLSRVLLKHCLQQEMSTDRWISIPGPVQDLYRQAGRPRPLYRARRLERFLKTPAKLYYKREDLSPTVQVEGFLPAPESAYAIRAAIDQALECKRMSQEKVIAFNISGHGFLDLPAYQEKLSF